MQSKGTAALGKWFGRVMLVWFTVLAGLGIYHIAQNPTVLKALNPMEGFYFLTHHGKASLIIMGSVFLVVTGGESLYADLGHFGRPAIARAWTFLVCPALMLNYLGQGALALSDPTSRDNPFFHMVPGWALYPLVALATTATVIASQALISGVFSLTMQGIQMGYIPRMEICHTSKDEHGQIYIPKINVLLGLGCAALVIGFGSSSALANAYGIAVTLTMLATTTIFYFAARRRLELEPAARRADLPALRLAGMRLLRRQFAQDPARRLVPARLRRAHFHRHDDLERWPHPAPQTSAARHAAG